MELGDLGAVVRIRARAMRVEYLAERSATALHSVDIRTLYQKMIVDSTDGRGEKVRKFLQMLKDAMRGGFVCARRASLTTRATGKDERCDE